MNGTLEYNQNEKRFGVIDSLDLWAAMLHCGDKVQVMIDGDWISTKIEMEKGVWYLPGTDKSGDQLRGLRVRIA